MRIEMSWRDDTRLLSLRLADGSRMRAPSPRTMEARVAGRQAKKTISFDGQPMAVQL